MFRMPNLVLPWFVLPYRTGPHRWSQNPPVSRVPGPPRRPPRLGRLGLGGFYAASLLCACERCLPDGRDPAAVSARRLGGADGADKTEGPVTHGLLLWWIDQGRGPMGPKRKFSTTEVQRRCRCGPGTEKV